MIQMELVFDGHDAAGKSTLAQLVAGELGGVYVKPFDSTLGDHMSWLWRHRRFTEANTLALSAVESAIEHNPNGPRIFDRHWATMFSVLPEEYWPAWQPVPATVICHTDAQTAYRRLAERGEDPQTIELHARYQKIYCDLGTRFGALVMDTASGSVDSCLAAALDFYRERQQHMPTTA
jgi:AAA domain